MLTQLPYSKNLRVCFGYTSQPPKSLLAMTITCFFSNLLEIG